MPGLLDPGPDTLLDDLTPALVAIHDGGGGGDAGNAAAAPAPAQAPAGGDAEGEGFVDRISRGIGLLGVGLGAGGSSVKLPKEEREAAGWRNLAAFGASLLANSGWSTEKRGLGQLVGVALGESAKAQEASERGYVGQQQQGQANRMKEMLLQLQGAHARVEAGNLALAQRKQAWEEGKSGNAGGAAADFIARVRGDGAGGGAGGGPPAGPGQPAQPAEPGTPWATLKPAEDGERTDLTRFADPALRDMIIAEAKKVNLDPQLALAVAHQESRGKPDVAATGDRGQYVGPFQIGEEEARGVGVTDRYPVANNVRAGVGRLKQLMDRYGGDQRRALLAYNAGEGRLAEVESGKRPVPDVSRQYIPNVLKITGWQPPAAAPVPSPGAAPGAAVVPDIDPKTGERTARVPAAPGAGWQPPARVVGKALFSDEEREDWARRMAGAATTGDQTKVDGVYKEYLERLGKLGEKRQWTIMSGEHASQVFGASYPPTAAVAVDMTGQEKPELLIPPSPAVNPNDTPAQALQRRYSEEAGKRMETLDAERQTARRNLGALEALQVFSDSAGPANIVQEKLPVMNRALQTLGIGTDRQWQRMNSQAAMVALTNELVNKMHEKGTGTYSNADADRVMAMMPTIGQTPYGRALIIETNKALLRDNVAYANAAEAYRNRAENHGSLQGFDAEWETRKPPVVPQSPLPSASREEKEGWYNGLKDGQLYEWRGIDAGGRPVHELRLKGRKPDG